MNLGREQQGQVAFSWTYYLTLQVSSTPFQHLKWMSSRVLLASAMGLVAQIAFRMGVIHVDEGVAPGGTAEECHRATEAISRLHQANTPDLPLYVVKLEDVFEAEKGNSATAVEKGTLLINLLQVKQCRLSNDALNHNVKEVQMHMPVCRIACIGQCSGKGS